MISKKYKNQTLGQFGVASNARRILSGCGRGDLTPHHRFALLFCAALASTVLPLHAQTGIFVKSSNNVGIGTTNPYSKLMVAGSIGMEDSNTVATDYIGRPRTDNGGNGLTGSNSAWMGFTVDSNYDQYLTFATVHNGVTGGERMRIDRDGNVGIGTTNPDGKLEIVGPNASAGNTNEGIRISATGVNDRLDLGTYGTAHYSWIRASQNGVGENNLMLQPFGGNVGIGTMSPVYPLDVTGAIHSSVTGGANLVLSKPLGSAIAFDDNAGSTKALIEANNGPGLEFWTNTANNAGLNKRMVIDNAGNVNVAGQVHATSFVASSGNNYADFVFKPGYKLQPLSAVEASIKKDGHLPGIPSEAEATAHGIDLTSMQVKLLQKIEELTLHQIDEEKRIEQLEKENAELRESLTK